MHHLGSFQSLCMNLESRGQSSEGICPWFHGRSRSREAEVARQLGQASFRAGSVQQLALQGLAVKGGEPVTSEHVSWLEAPGLGRMPQPKGRGAGILVPMSLCVQVGRGGHRHGPLSETRHLPALCTQQLRAASTAGPRCWLQSVIEPGPEVPIFSPGVPHSLLCCL